MRAWRYWMILALLACAPAGPAADAMGQKDTNDPAKSSAPSAAATGSSQQTLFAGTYRYAGSAQQEEARRAAIDRAVEPMSFVIRSTARSRISETTQILGSYSFSFEPGKIVVRPQSRPEMISGENGEVVDYEYNGKRSQMTQRFAEGRISQGFESGEGKRENEFTLSRDGQVLTLKVTLTSPRLSVPVIYSLSYKKAD